MFRFLSFTALCTLSAAAVMPLEVLTSPEPSMEPMAMMQSPEPSLKPLPFIPTQSMPMITSKPHNDHTHGEAEVEAEHSQEPGHKGEHGGAHEESADIDTSVMQTPEPTSLTAKPSVPNSITNEQAGTHINHEHAKRPNNEGCVAIEHLRGYALQHPHHLRRHVLCANSFCATPNHHIIVDGVHTSMKQLCASQWQCVESVKLVNNLKIARNRRAIVSDRITVTPYDLRFPKAASWIAQIAEDVWYLLSSSTLLGAVLAVVALVAGNSNVR